MKIEVKPRDKSKIYMFEHKGEAIVFWLCISGLLILTFFTIFRHYSINKLKATYRTFQTASTPILSSFEKLENQNIELRNQSDSLRRDLQDNKNTMVRMQTELDNLKTNLNFFSEKSYQNSQKNSIQESTRQQPKGPLLKTFKIKTVTKKIK